jgi:hypothetical protein
MLNRLRLDTELKALFGPTVTVYYQPPSNVEMRFPACIYSFENFVSKLADNVRYIQFERYSVKLLVPTMAEPFVMDLLKNPKFTYVTSYPTGAAQYVYIFRTTI